MTAAFGWLSAHAGSGSAAARRAAIAAAAVMLVLALLAGLAAIIWLDLRCDEACAGSGWEHTRGAWQWWAQAALALGGVIGAGAALVEAIRRRQRPATVWAVIAGASLAIWAVSVPFGEAFPS